VLPTKKEHLIVCEKIHDEITVRECMSLFENLCEENIETFDGQINAGTSNEVTIMFYNNTHKKRIIRCHMGSFSTRNSRCRDKATLVMTEGEVEQQLIFAIEGTRDEIRFSGTLSAENTASQVVLEHFREICGWIYALGHMKRYVEEQKCLALEAKVKKEVAQFA